MAAGLGYRPSLKETKYLPYLHIAQRASNLCPNSVNIIVEGLEGVDLEFRLLIGEKGKNAGGGDEARHCEFCLKAGNGDEGGC